MYNIKQNIDKYKEAAIKSTERLNAAREKFKKDKEETLKLLKNNKDRLDSLKPLINDAITNAEYMLKENEDIDGSDIERAHDTNKHNWLFYIIGFVIFVILLLFLIF